MRIFQNAGLYPSYRQHFDRCHGVGQSFTVRRKKFLDDRFGAAHLLLPVLEESPEAFFTNGDDEVLQRAWARENGLSLRTPLPDVLLAQIEAHRTEVFYNLDPMRYGNEFLRRLPGCVRYSLAWRAAPSPGADFSGYGLLLCNFPSILEGYRRRGWRAAYFSPAHDPAMDSYARNEDRPVDILFVGGYTRHHMRRARMLEIVAALAPARVVRFHLDRSRLTRLAESPLGLLSPLARHRRPDAIRRVGAEPVFGLDLYGALSRAKVVLNGAIDMAGADRGNMRCFEAMGCGALLVSDEGNYPEGMLSGENMLTYAGQDDVADVLAQALDNWSATRQVAAKGNLLMRNVYNKAGQWQDFLRIVGAM